MKRTHLLVILDGWGIGAKNETNPIHVANPPHFEYLKRHFPMGSLQASGIAVGLPWEEEGNSEVGHVTIGSGKVLYQHFPKITLAIRDKSFFKNETLNQAADFALQNNGTLHLAGLLTKGNVHASLDHLKALLQFATEKNVPVALHLFADGKDSPPKSFLSLIKEVPREIIASVSGRYYAMDRDMHWERTEQAYRAIVGTAPIIKNPEEEAEKVFKNDLIEEYMEPTNHEGGPGGVKDGDSLIFFNFREDSMRQLVEAFALQNFEHFATAPLQNVFIATMTTYSDRFPLPVLFPTEKVEQPLTRVLADKNLMQLHIAETEKYAHVTYFFNGYKDPPFSGEYRILVPSRNVARHDEYPQMMAEEITSRVVRALDERAFDFIVINYANPDTIAHTGNFMAGVRAVEIIDNCIGQLVEKILEVNGIMIITSDHGNIEQMTEPFTGLPETKHNKSPVPVHLIGRAYERERGDAEIEQKETQTMGIISDIAPTILDLMQIPIPKEMTGQTLLPLLAYY